MVRTAVLVDGTVIKSHPLFGGYCTKHKMSCGCYNELQRRFQNHLSKLFQQRKYEEAERKQRKFSTLVAHEYAFGGRT